MTATWTVPANPTPQYPSGTVYYAFPALSNDYYSFQPTLQYGSNGIYGGQYWTIASWAAHDSTDFFHTPARTVAHGLALYGRVDGFPDLGTDTAFYDVTTGVVGGDSVSLWYSNGLMIGDQRTRYVHGGGVQVFGITSCSQYPADRIVFSGIAVYDENLSRVYPAWNPWVNSGASPQCGFNVASPTSDTVKLYHNPAPAPTVTSLTTNPSPPKQYLPATYTITGSGFDPATAEALVYGDSSISSCPNPTPCYIRNYQFSVKTSAQLVAQNIAWSIPGPYTLRVRNGDGGNQSYPGRSFRVVPMY